MPPDRSRSDAKAGWDAAWDYVMEAHLGTGVAWPKERLEAEQEHRDAMFEKWADPTSRERYREDMAAKAEGPDWPEHLPPPIA